MSTFVLFGGGTIEADGSGGGSASISSFQRNFGLSIHYAKPLWTDYGNDGDLTAPHNSYSHTIAANGGYASAEIELAGDYRTAMDWLAYGLGRDIEAYGASQELIWKGFVNQIDISFGPLALGRGPLVDIVNRLTIKYTDFTVGQPARTTAINDEQSQAKYGIIQKAVSAGTVSSTTADNIAATTLREQRFPETSPQLSSQGNDVSIKVSCLGYSKFLELYTYNIDVDTTYTLREKVLEVLSQDPNGIFSTNYAEIEANTLSVNRLDNDDRTALTVLQELQNIGGDADNNRRLLSVYGQERLVSLQSIPQVVDYNIRLSEGGPAIETVSGEIVYPWNILPGKWVDMVDFQVEDNPNITLREDPSKVFIETVTFTAPFDWSISGGKTDTLSQQLAKLAFGN